MIAHQESAYGNRARDAGSDVEDPHDTTATSLQPLSTGRVKRTALSKGDPNRVIKSRQKQLASKPGEPVDDSERAAEESSGKHRRRCYLSAQKTRANRRGQRMEVEQRQKV